MKTNVGKMYKVIREYEVLLPQAKDEARSIQFVEEAVAGWIQGIDSIASPGARVDMERLGIIEEDFKVYRLRVCPAQRTTPVTPFVAGLVQGMGGRLKWKQ